MRERSPWQPRLAQNSTSPTDQLVQALSEDILSGLLNHGARLPAHRDLADTLGIALGTVTKAYGILEKRGLVRSVKGSGMFVALANSRSRTLVDLSQNTPPAALTSRSLSTTLAAIARRPDMDMFNSYAPAVGHDEHRRLLAQWFSGLGLPADYRQLMLTNGAQHALSVALSTVCQPFGRLYVEEQTYSGLIQLSRLLKLTLVGIPMDDEGIDVSILEHHLDEHAETGGAVYVTPLLQSPTTRIMSLDRRQELIRICRERGITIIEDDVYRLTRDTDLPQIARLAPDITLYVNSLSKILNPALRIGGLLVPETLYSRAEAMLRATAMMVSPVSSAIMEQWLIDGTAETVTLAIEHETKRRYQLTIDILGEHVYRSGQPSFHIWMPFSREDAQSFYQAAMAAGIKVTPPASTEVSEQSDQSGIRLCIGGTDIEQLTQVLLTLKGIAEQIKQQPDPFPLFRL
ncbi:TPA: PLP-dependent aminotransferase family protein [Klebsiella variicola]|uniref:aminotransferase-like domain-containing protein n=1 Tax=Klebsiella variicola TaxID=244366 RepID=UPI00109BBA26|nr:PLP-dependent aminotransferase family protein [Klebsiella variicola]QHW95989.1 PLP-dependent aminotransferase family protein [Klebsiella variicola]VGP82904.1 2-aminoadipate transaminase [Klebsiella variicola]HCI9592463.1 PLP-dependent aminotransferase family protein [Klebsiella variicola]HCI9594539.1 PLP-dependent aminotransferase family protein [Klebsiella variicola]HCI9594592.1 PLP-dependent aminotransferase family protein [Klebsiella variicola]